MDQGFHALSEREKETLRLLLVGHDVKSVSARLGLSVHTVNERLREARRKLGVTSSRQAARLLADMEGRTPNYSADKQSGVAAPSAPIGKAEPSDHRRGVGYPLAWLGGGMLIMSLIIASFVLSASLQGAGETPRPAPARLIAAAAAPGLADAAGANAAKDWLALVDGQRWAQSWTAAGTLFRTHISQAGWASNVQSVRQPLGPVTSRVLQNIARSASLPGAPDGEYEVVQFATDFSNKHDAVETVALARESSGWKVIGYYIK